MPKFLVHESTLCRQTLIWEVTAESEEEAVEKMYDGNIKNIEHGDTYESEIVEVEEVTEQ